MAVLVTTTRITTTMCCPSSNITGTAEYVTLEDIYEAYYDCRKNKRSKASALAFEMHHERELRKLWVELNDMTYTISPSIVFAVTRPKLREVFAADFRDRVVHHLLMLRLEPIIESEMIDESFNCRKGKGTDYGVKTLQRHIKEVSNDYQYKAYVIQCDIQGFFMSIDKDILWRKVSTLMKREWKYGNLEWWLWLTKKIIYHRPEQNCIIHGDPRLLDMLPDNKTLFRSNGKGLPIGNLTSQIFGNYYLTDFDRWILAYIGEGARYGRYVDDFYVAGRRLKMHLLPVIRERLKNNEHLTLHPHKASLVEVRKGVKFVGSVIKPWGTYTGNRTVNNAMHIARMSDVADIEKHVQRLNSYFGFMIHRLTYGIRWRIWKEIPEGIRKSIYCVSMKKLRLRPQTRHSCNTRKKVVWWQNGRVIIK